MVGRYEAKRDVACGRYALRLHGTPAGWRRDQAALLRAKYDIHLRVGGCIVSGFDKTYDREYNQIQHPAITNKFGRDVIKECAEEAEAAWKRKLEQLTAKP